MLFAAAPLLATMIATTIAGSGKQGVQDGVARAAQFVEPFGVAVDLQGDVVISDAGAQRIRLLDRSGHVSTIAGTGSVDMRTALVPGGNVDGPALSAHFNHPSGVAVQSDGTIVIADEYNGSIRAVRGGRVSTLAGGMKDPKAVAADGQGNVYVADFGAGVKRVSNGVVTNLVPSLSKVLSVAWSRADPDHLYAASTDGFSIVDIQTGAITNRKGMDSPAEGIETFGYPFALSVLAPNVVVYTDLRTHAVRLLAFSESSYAVALSDIPNEVAHNRGGGFGDGTHPLFNSPCGIAVKSDGSVVVADTGNKRIRLLSNVDLRLATDPLLPQLAARDQAKTFRVAYLGNSYVWTAVSFDESTAGFMQRSLNEASALHSSHKLAQVIALRRLGLTANNAETLIKNELVDGLVDTVVLLLNSNVVEMTYGPHEEVFSTDLAPDWETRLTSRLKSISQLLASNHERLLVAIQPYPDEISPLENVYTESTGGNDLLHLPDGRNADYSRFHSSLLRSVALSGVTYLDLWPVFLREIASANNRPLYSALDTHFTPWGNEVSGIAIAKKLIEMRAWTLP